MLKKLRKRVHVFIAALLIYSVSSKAAPPSLQTQKAVNNICRIETVGSGENGSCSGFFVVNSPNFLTAAHCFKLLNPTDSYLFCSDLSQLHFDSRNTQKGDPNSPANDWAIARLARKKGPSLAVPNSLEQYSRVLKLGKCFLIGGSGRIMQHQDEGDTTTVSYNRSKLSARLIPLEAKNFNKSDLSRCGLSNFFNYQNKGSLLFDAPGFQIAKGDSGGPVVCEDENGYPVVVGIASHVSIIGRPGCHLIAATPITHVPNVILSTPWIDFQRGH